MKYQANEKQQHQTNKQNKQTKNPTFLKYARQKSERLRIT